MTEKDLEAVSLALESSHSDEPLVQRDRGVVVAVAIIVVCIVAAMSIPLTFLLSDRNDARSEAARLRIETLCRSGAATKQDVAVAAVLDSFAVLLLAGTRGLSPQQVIPRVEAAQQQLAAASAERSRTDLTCVNPPN